MTFNLGPHAFYIVLAYGAAALIIGALIAWAFGGERRQRRMLAHLERQGVKRRSAAK